ncbi:hypothetical protein vBSdyM006_100 [Shigella phage vB_SdyM_006]|nr:hypothetical protein vBSdyM006_100 [Shigella phage vB_SdyM_006]
MTEIHPTTIIRVINNSEYDFAYVGNHTILTNELAVVNAITFKEALASLQSCTHKIFIGTCCLDKDDVYYINYGTSILRKQNDY